MDVLGRHSTSTVFAATTASTAKPLQRVGLFKYSRASILTDSLSAVSVIRSLQRPEKNGKLKK
jgi:hypothetical protein